MPKTFTTDCGFELIPGCPQVAVRPATQSKQWVLLGIHPQTGETDCLALYDSREDCAQIGREINDKIALVPPRSWGDWGDPAHKEFIGNLPSRSQMQERRETVA